MTKIQASIVCKFSPISKEIGNCATTMESDRDSIFIAEELMVFLQSHLPGHRPKLHWTKPPGGSIQAGCLG